MPCLVITARNKQRLFTIMQNFSFADTPHMTVLRPHTLTEHAVLNNVALEMVPAFFLTLCFAPGVKLPGTAFNVAATILHVRTGQQAD